MFKGPRLKSAPFAPFGRSFLPEFVLRKAGFVKGNDTPYERNTSTKTTHNEYFKISLDSMFGSPSPKILRLDTLRERFTIANSQKGRGQYIDFSDIKSIKQDSMASSHIIITQNDFKRSIAFSMESPEIALSFVQKLETLVQARKMADKS
ncbi:hypothetical protein TRFO_11503 [Tritrichomonas foetus]|uniref:Uncharacterized protein n=1 Tax=Tritrichomonas foetus TaxID=1144522 RepID=A0A1J4J3K6_9EUKA|nr:hypothetical protein TRFO_11503 [Tritrichomonas foetus]|eukprot:OHS94006.1 hypothetical protein TRFO_11503 [Tritrichomonas foetus]